MPLVHDAASDTRAAAPDRMVSVVQVDAESMGPVDDVEDSTPVGVFSPPPLTPPAVVLGDDLALNAQ